MPEGSIERRLDRIEESVLSVRETQVHLVAQIEEMNGHVQDLQAEVGRVPRFSQRGQRLPITDRLHTIENVVSPAAQEAMMHRVLDSRKAAGWTHVQKRALFATAIVGAIASVSRLFGLGG